MIRFLELILSLLPLATFQNQVMANPVQAMNRNSGGHGLEWINVLDYGADSTGTTSSDSAFVAAMTAAFNSTNPSENKPIYIPPGQYLITHADLLNAWSAKTPYRRFVMIAGAGPGITNVIFRPVEPDAYLYDGKAVSSRRFMHLTIRDLSITADGSLSNSQVNLFRQYGNNDGHPDQGYTFSNTRLDADAEHPGILLRIEGPYNGSENRLLFSRGRFWKSVISSTNVQAVNNYVVACDWELTKGAVFNFSGGGQLTVIGGSYILGSRGDSLGGSLLQVNSGIGGITGTFNFTGIRTEVYDRTAILYNLNGPNTGMVINVIGATHRVLNGGDLVLARVNSYGGARLLFKGCDLAPNSNHLRIEFTNSEKITNWYRSYSSASTVQIEDSHIEPDLNSYIRWEPNSEGGLFRTRGCSARQ